jgi:maltose alpha-D-glucosyltransferase / alpha-amylase
VDLTRDREHTSEHDPAEGSRVEDGVVEHPNADEFTEAKSLPADPTWFKHAVFYEVLVRAFLDGDGDGSGDLRGLLQRLDYLQWLGIDCIWLPPFYDSPLRDGGYDIRDFYKVLPEFGTVDDFVALLNAAHERGIRVITDLVMNHTSE